MSSVYFKIIICLHHRRFIHEESSSLAATSYKIYHSLHVNIYNHVHKNFYDSPRIPRKKKITRRPLPKNVQQPPKQLCLHSGATKDRLLLLRVILQQKHIKASLLIEPRTNGSRGARVTRARNKTQTVCRINSLKDRRRRRARTMPRKTRRKEKGSEEN